MAIIWNVRVLKVDVVRTQGQLVVETIQLIAITLGLFSHNRVSDCYWGN